MVEQARSYLVEGADVYKSTADVCMESILAAADLIAASLRHGGKLLICGNGGSAADSQHLASEFVSVLSRRHPRPAMAAIALTSDSSILTSIGNDFGYAGVFERQVEALARAGDVLLCISTSGNSENVIRAAQRALAQQAKVLVLTGANGRLLKPLGDVAVCIPSEDVQHIQEAHVAVEHLLCLLVEQQLFGTKVS